MHQDKLNKLADQIRETSFAVHKYFKNGFLEKIYENSLCNRLRKQGLRVEQQSPIKVYDEDGTIVGEYFADLLIEDSIIVELKSVKSLLDEHFGQILGYLRATKQEHGLLINFGAPKLQIRKFVL